MHWEGSIGRVEVGVRKGFHKDYYWLSSFKFRALGGMNALLTGIICLWCQQLDNLKKIIIENKNKNRNSPFKQIGLPLHSTPSLGAAGSGRRAVLLVSSKCLFWEPG